MTTIRSRRPELKTFWRLLAGVGVLALSATAWVSSAQAESIIKQPGLHPDYGVEVEPHLVFGWSKLNDKGAIPTETGKLNGWGPGVRLSFPIVHNGFIPSLNNSIAIGTGLDWIHYSLSDSFLIPAVLQWNFHFSRVITVFGEPGVALRHLRVGDTTNNKAMLILQGGAKFMLSPDFGITVRAGFPYLSVGASMLF